MKVQYFGDVNDYKKFALLRLLASIGGFKIGVCWLMTADDDRPDGNNRGFHKDSDGWRKFDPGLFDSLKTVPEKPQLVDLMRVEGKNLIPGASYFNDRTPTEKAERAAFHARCMTAFANVDLVFFDPDNGLDVASCPKGRKNSDKYVYEDEITAHYADRRSVLIYQHFPRVEREAFLVAAKGRLARRCPDSTIWAFRTPYVAFLFAVRPEHADAAARAGDSLAQIWPRKYFQLDRLTDRFTYQVGDLVLLNDDGREIDMPASKRE